MLSLLKFTRILAALSFLISILIPTNAYPRGFLAPPGAIIDQKSFYTNTELQERFEELQRILIDRGFKNYRLPVHFTSHSFVPSISREGLRLQEGGDLLWTVVWDMKDDRVLEAFKQCALTIWRGQNNWGVSEITDVFGVVYDHSDTFIGIEKEISWRDDGVSTRGFGMYGIPGISRMPKEFINLSWCGIDTNQLDSKTLPAQYVVDLSLSEEEVKEIINISLDEHDNDIKEEKIRTHIAVIWLSRQVFA